MIIQMLARIPLIDVENGGDHLKGQQIAYFYIGQHIIIKKQEICAHCDYALNLAT